MSNFKKSFLSASLAYTTISFACQHLVSFRLQHISTAQALDYFNFLILPHPQITTSQLLIQEGVSLRFSSENRTILLTGQTEESINMVKQQIVEQIDRP